MFHALGLLSTLTLSWMMATLPTKSVRQLASYREIAEASIRTCETLECVAKLTAIAGYESDFSTWARGPQGEVGPWQIKLVHLPKGKETPLLEQAAIALRLVEASEAECGDLTGYTSGRCGWGKRESVQRLKLAAELLEQGSGHIERECDRRKP